jgi:rSAM/selenodomain-associated transferase 2
MAALSIVVPVLDDGPNLVRLVGELQRSAEETPLDLEIIVVDAGSREDPGLFLPESVRLLRAVAPNRGAQLELGVEAAVADWLWLLHADCSGVAAPLRYLAGLSRPCWGRFDVALSCRSTWRRAALRIIAAFMNWRSRLTGICTGDQGIFVHRSVLEIAGGIPAQPLMEDVEVTQRLKRICRPDCPRIKLTTSARRWESHGILSTVVSMWAFRLRYWLGADPEQLAARYYGRS